MGQCLLFGWSEYQFYKSTPRAVFNLIIAARNKAEQESRERWEQTRMLCDFIIAPHKRKGTTGRSFELPWDSEVKSEKAEVLTPEELRKRFEERDRKVKKRFQNA